MVVTPESIGWSESTYEGSTATKRSFGFPTRGEGTAEDIFVRLRERCAASVIYQ